MMPLLHPLATNCARFVLIVGLVCLTPFQVRAAELKVELKLVWGTNEKKSPNPKHKPIDDAIAAKMRKVFAWTNYFEVNRVVGTVPSRGTGRFQMSNKCTIEITEVEGPKVEVKLIGEGKPANKTTLALRKGDTVNIAGGSKDGSAWFVLITEL